jgi:hypothetical protein
MVEQWHSNSTSAVEIYLGEGLTPLGHLFRVEKESNHLRIR